MKKVIVLAVILAVWVAGAEGYLGQVVGSIYSPSPGVRGLAIGPDYIYVLTRWSSTYMVWTCNPSTGSVVGSWAVGNYEYGLGYENPGYLWVRYGPAPYNGLAFKRLASNGTLVASFALNHLVDIGGLACEGNPDVPYSVTGIYSNRDDRVYRYTTTGTLTRSFTITGTGFLMDPAWDYVSKLLWVPDHADNGYFRGFTTNGSLVASFPTPRYSSYTTKPSASCYKAGYLYVTGDLPGTHVTPIWKVDCPANVTVRPRSLGVIKTLYR